MQAAGPLSRFALRAGAWLGPPRGAVSTAVRGALALAWWLWLVELAADAASGAAGASDGPLGPLLALFFGAALALTVGLVFGALVRASRGPLRNGESTSSTGLADWLWHPGAAQAERVISVLAAAALFKFVCFVGFGATRALVIGIARPHFAALAILGVYLALALACVLLWPAARLLAEFVARLAKQVPFARAIVGTAGALAVFLVVATLVFVAVLAGAYRQSLEYLPWRTMGLVTLACSLTLGWRFAARRASVFAAVGRAITALLFLVAVAAALGARAEDAGARQVAQRGLLGGTGYAALQVALDFDRDGHLHLFGGGDCAPFDVGRSPGAIDVPNNRIDEDCDGVDLNDELLVSSRTRYDWPVPADVPRQPSIVLVTIDTFAAAHMGALGDRRKLTPNLDALAARSSLFTNCFSQGPSTRLSFPSIFTSRWDSEIRQELIGSHPYPIHDSEELLAETLQRAGYDTVAVLPDSYFGKQRWSSLTQGFRTVVDQPYATRPQPKHNSALVTDAAIEVLGRRRTQPLFLWAHYYDAHSPHTQPAGAERLGTSRRALYDAELRYVDGEVGRLVAAIGAKVTGAVIVVTSDHGIAFDEPRHAQFNYGYDLHTPVLHVPLIVSAPFVRAQRVDEIVSTMDIAPTLSNLLRVRSRAKFRGASLVPELLEGKRTRPQTLLHEFYLQERLWKEQDPLESVALRTARFSLIHDRKNGIWQLYDWTRDYDEIDDLSGQSEYAATLSGLKQQLSLLTYKVHRGGRHAAHAEAR